MKHLLSRKKSYSKKRKSTQRQRGGIFGFTKNEKNAKLYGINTKKLNITPANVMSYIKYYNQHKSLTQYFRQKTICDKIFEVLVAYRQFVEDIEEDYENIQSLPENVVEHYRLLTLPDNEAEYDKLLHKYYKNCKSHKNIQFIKDLNERKKCNKLSEDILEEQAFFDENDDNRMLFQDPEAPRKKKYQELLNQYYKKCEISKKRDKIAANDYELSIVPPTNDDTHDEKYYENLKIEYQKKFNDLVKDPLGLNPKKDMLEVIEHFDINFRKFIANKKDKLNKMYNSFLKNQGLSYKDNNSKECSGDFDLNDQIFHCYSSKIKHSPTYKKLKEEYNYIENLNETINEAILSKMKSIQMENNIDSRSPDKTLFKSYGKKPEEEDRMSSSTYDEEDEYEYEDEDNNKDDRNQRLSRVSLGALGGRKRRRKTHKKRKMK